MLWAESSDIRLWSKAASRCQPDGYRAERVIFVVTTDGLENASRTFSCSRMERMIEVCRRQSWEFVFLGASIDAVEEAEKLGINEDHAVQYACDGEGVGLAYSAMAEATCVVRDLGRMPTGWNARVNEDARKRS